ncbi:MAG: Gfo/Idh/MocA family oxidoreductase, partial [Lachnospiraceae bacterium]|nr:Gfo/Idh/MocA family oxidoreductase [Lachnospiraceae bacterium]
VRLLQRAKELGDYLVVGVTSEDFDRKRGKINVKQSLMERIEGLKKLEIADEIIVEEYEGQKIDDIKRYGIDVFTVGSDWTGKFDYLNEYCQVVYLERTEGVSSTEIRAEKSSLSLGLVGDDDYLLKIFNESRYINGIEDIFLYRKKEDICGKYKDVPHITNDYSELLRSVDAVYVHSFPENHYKIVKQALEERKHVLCEAPIVLETSQMDELVDIAKTNGCILMNSLRTAYSTAYTRLLLLIKSGVIGQVISIDATCTSLKNKELLLENKLDEEWNSICEWGPTAMLPVFQILGTDYVKKTISSNLLKTNPRFDTFTKIDFIYPKAVATIKVGQGVKAEGDLVISGTEGYIYIPAPWWKTDYFEVRYENMERNKRYFYQLDGEGIRYLLLAFCKAISSKKDPEYFSHEVSSAIVQVIEDFYNKRDLYEI